MNLVLAHTIKKLATMKEKPRDKRKDRLKKKMKDKNMDIQEIIEITGLSKEEIEKL